MPKITSADKFKQFVERFETGGRARPRAFGVGIATCNSRGVMLDTWFPYPNFEANYGTAAVLSSVVGYQGGRRTCDMSVEQLDAALDHFEWTKGDGKVHHNVEALKHIRAVVAHYEPRGISEMPRRTGVVCFIPNAEDDVGANTVPDAYLRLHLLSHRLVRPQGINLDRIFATLPNNVWTSEGAVHEEDLLARQMDALVRGQPLTIHSRDKFPRMLDYVVPTGVRIADANRVRLGAYLGDGVTVMHEGFCNFNAGAEGPNMIEGRISAGVFVKAHSDIGGGASIMGTLSGGGKQVIEIGEHCLIGANGGTGISLGDYCTIEAGLYITASTKVMLESGEVVKAGTLSGENELFFIRDSRSGVVKMSRRKNSVELNKILHANA